MQLSARYLRQLTLLLLKDGKMTAGQKLGVIKKSGALIVKGKDSIRFLNGMLTQDIQTNMLPNAGRSFFLTPKGKIISSLFFVVLNAEEVCLWTNEKDVEALKQSLEKYLIADKVEITKLGTFDSATLAESDFKFEQIKTKHPLGQEKIFSAIVNDQFYVAPQGLLSPTHVEVLYKGGGTPSLGQEDLWEKSFQAGQPQWGVDLFAEDFFLEFPLADAVSFDKGCYIGQETVARGTFRGKVNKVYTQFVSDKKISTGEIFSEGGEKLGEIRSVRDNKATGILKRETPSSILVIDGVTHEMQIKALVAEDTFRKGR